MSSTEPDRAELEPAPSSGGDVGGPFTDFVHADHEAGRLSVLKVASTRDDPARAVLDGLRHLDPGSRASVAHGTTVATNALLERRDARVAFVTTAGFGDLLRLGRGERAELYALSPADRPCLVADEDVFEVAERLDAAGGVVLPLTASEAERVASAVAASAVEAVAICFLHAYASARHERAMAAAIAAALAERGRSDVSIACSVDVLPEMREYERASTTVLSAYLTRPVRGYIERLAEGVRPRRLTIMGSHGGTLSPRSASADPLATVLSGPAAGVAGALHVAERAGLGAILTFDMGGTSTDVAVCQGRAPLVARATVEGFAVGRELIDIHTVGAGGGSIIRADEAGALRVGPGSAGAVPGPACYGRGGVEATITDAHAVLGRLPDGLPLGGGLDGSGSGVRVDAEASRRALAPLAERLGMELDAAALAALRIVESVMERALRRVTVERGIDPAELGLVAFGGAGPLHACALAASLGIRSVLLPAAPGALSALGLLVTPPASSASRTVLRRAPSGARAASASAGLEAAFGELESACLQDLAGAAAILETGRTPASVERRRAADLRYAGQAWEITVPWKAGETRRDVERRFEAMHGERYGYRSDGAEIEIVTLRARAIGPAPPEPPPPLAEDSSAGRDASHRRARVVDDAGRVVDGPLVDRASLTSTTTLHGPAIIVQSDCTTWLPSSWRARRLVSNAVLLERTTDQEAMTSSSP